MAVGFRCSISGLSLYEFSCKLVILRTTDADSYVFFFSVTSQREKKNVFLLGHVHSLLIGNIVTTYMKISHLTVGLCWHKMCS